VLPFDFCIPELKVIIEMDGAQHFRQISNWLSPEETIKRDVFKMQKAEEYGYKVIRITQEDVYAGGEEWMDANLLPDIVDCDRRHSFISEKEGLYARHIELYSSGVPVVF
jgi:very-short-patch-repair endonuclease